MKDKVVGQLFPIYQADDPQGRPRAAREDMMMMIHRKPKQRITIKSIKLLVDITSINIQLSYLESSERM